MNKRLSDKLDIDQLAELLGCKTVSDYYDGLIDSFYCNVEDCEHDSESCPDVAESDDAYRKYIGALEDVALKVFGEHHLLLVKDNGIYIGPYTIKPTVSWKDSADCIRMTINGMGYFEFNSVKNFMDSGPYTPRQCVLEHLHWIKNWFDVNEGSKAKSEVERRISR